MLQQCVERENVYIHFIWQFHFVYIQFVKKIFAQKKKSVKCDLHSKIPTIKSLHTFLHLHTFYNCTCLRPIDTNSFLIATHITIQQQKKFTQYKKCQKNSLHIE